MGKCNEPERRIEVSLADALVRKLERAARDAGLSRRTYIRRVLQYSAEQDLRIASMGGSAGRIKGSQAGQRDQR